MTLITDIKSELAKKVVGQDKVVDSLLRGILANGHILIEGVPGLAKTVIIKSLAEIIGIEFNRVQFTIDLLPSDIIGVNSFNPEAGYKVVKGPVFCNILLADEINRASPKVQSALLEAMAEKQVTIGKETIPLPRPFFVFATQNPLESLGTYPLPQAQLDRFIFKLVIRYPGIDEEIQILDKNQLERTNRLQDIKKLLTGKTIIDMQQEVADIYVAENVKRYIVQIIDATRNPQKYDLDLAQYIEVGCGPRATISLLQSAKAEAYLNGRSFVTPHDIKEVAYDVLRHRIAVNYLGQAKEVQSDKIIQEILLKIPQP